MISLLIRGFKQSQQLTLTYRDREELRQEGPSASSRAPPPFPSPFWQSPGDGFGWFPPKTIDEGEKLTRLLSPAVHIWEIGRRSMPGSIDLLVLSRA